MSRSPRARGGIVGGTGTIFGVTLAVLIIGFLIFGLSLMNVPGIVMNIFVGMMLISSIALPKALTAVKGMIPTKPKGQ